METGCLPIKHRSVLIVIIKFGVISLKFIRLMLGVSRKSTNFPCEQIMLDSHMLLTALSQKMSSCVHMVALQGAMQRDFLLLNSSAFLQHLALGIIWSWIRNCWKKRYFQQAVSFPIPSNVLGFRVQFSPWISWKWIVEFLFFPFYIVLYRRILVMCYNLFRKRCIPMNWVPSSWKGLLEISVSVNAC